MLFSKWRLRYWNYLERWPPLLLVHHRNLRMRLVGVYLSTKHVANPLCNCWSWLTPVWRWQILSSALCPTTAGPTTTAKQIMMKHKQRKKNNHLNNCHWSEFRTIFCKKSSFRTAKNKGFWHRNTAKTTATASGMFCWPCAISTTSTITYPPPFAGAGLGPSVLAVWSSTLTSILALGGSVRLSRHKGFQ